jgi:hypothetical protein
MKAERENRAIAVLIKIGWVVNATLRSLYPQQ